MMEYRLVIHHWDFLGGANGVPVEPPHGSGWHPVFVQHDNPVNGGTVAIVWEREA